MLRKRERTRELAMRTLCASGHRADRYLQLHVCIPDSLPFHRAVPDRSIIRPDKSVASPAGRPLNRVCTSLPSMLPLLALRRFEKELEARATGRSRWIDAPLPDVQWLWPWRGAGGHSEWSESSQMGLGVATTLRWQPGSLAGAPCAVLYCTVQCTWHLFTD